MGLNIEKINNQFSKLGEKIIKFRWLNIFLFILILVISFIGIQKIETDTSNDNWFLDNDATKIAKDRFEEIFGNSDFAAVLIEVDDIFTQDNLQAIREMSNELEKFVPLADDILSITDFEFSIGSEYGLEIIDLIPDEIPTNKDSLNSIKQLALSKKSMIGKLYNQNCTESWVLIRFKEFPKDWKTDNDYIAFFTRTVEEFPKFFKNLNKDKPQSPEVLIGYVIEQITTQEKYQILNPKTTGMPIINFEKRRFFGQEAMRLSLLAILLSALVLALTLKSFRGIIFPILTSVTSMIIVFGIQGFLGIKIDPSMITLPMFLGFAVSVGYSVHIFTFYQLSLRQKKSCKESTVYAIKESGWPILFTALTTIGALMSFMFIHVKTLRWIGLTSACLVTVVYLTTIFLLPSLISFGKVKQKKHNQKIKSNTKLELFMGNLSDCIVRNPIKIVVLFIVFTVICIVGITQIEVSFDIEKSMGNKVDYAKRLLYVGASELGSLYSYEIGFEFPNPGDAKKPENLRKLEILENEILTFELTKKTSSILDIIKDIYQTLNENKSEYYKIPEISDISHYSNNISNPSEIEQQIIAQTMLLYENAGGAEAERWIDYE
ncbi:MAG: MMPL family transporter, partial [Candidatus Cloacimonetes bacterium]|nr:MMPL family transporter [Candidatus Cloacimonadota bacterium]